MSDSIPAGSAIFQQLGSGSPSFICEQQRPCHTARAIIQESPLRNRHVISMRPWEVCIVAMNWHVADMLQRTRVGGIPAEFWQHDCISSSIRNRFQQYSATARQHHNIIPAIFQEHSSSVSTLAEWQQCCWNLVVGTFSSVV